MTDIFMHICCAPCACYTSESLNKEGFNITGFWFNPNIHGYREYLHRKMALGYYVAKIFEMDIIEEAYDPADWIDKLDCSDRCAGCYRLRIDKTAQTAKKHNIKKFTTTLLYSRFQKHSLIKTIGEEAAEKYGVEFVYRDFREGWKEGIALSKKFGLYRQEYCGCLFSETERYCKEE